MVACKELTENLSISSALSVTDLESVKAQGFDVVICNRPDNEELGQLHSSEIESRAAELGLQFFHIPINMKGPSMEAVHATKKAFDAYEGKAIAYCKSGMRSVVLWSLATAMEGDISTDELISKATSVGFDISGLRPTLDSLAG